MNTEATHPHAGATHPHTGRPMRRKAREMTEPAEIESVLQGEMLMHLAMSQNNVPFLVPVYFGWDGQALYFHSANAGSKIDILRANPEVCFEISSVAGFIEAGEACDFEARHRTVIGFGRAVFVEDEAEKIRALDLIVAHFTTQHFEYPKDNLAKTFVIRIDVHSMKGKQHGF
jgi:nitroimidazol reductase NimA-like FMN-containing flavoprotein (pyridoxamine 5'-phosphate oxidase superfamily)